MAKQRSNQHLKAQKAGRVRDLNRCQICGSTSHPEGHHIINVQHGGAADSNNIVTLCRSCHKDVHRGLIDMLLI